MATNSQHLWWAPLALALLLALILGACTEVEKPEWWPEKREGYKEVPWPPTKPKDWEGPWPPQRDLDWWVRHFRGRNEGWFGGKPGDPEDPKGAGYAGSYTFAQGFRPIDDKDRPDCGLFALIRLEYVTVPSCAPFPAKVVKQQCDKARDAKVAKTACRKACRSRPRCRQSRLFEPEMWVSWKCERYLLPPHDFQASCVAWFLCECWEL